MLLLLRNPAVGTPPPPPPAVTELRGGFLYPSLTTYPDTTTYPGQGQKPMLQILISTDDVSASSPLWSYVAENDMRAFSISRGRESELSLDDAGTATVVLDNRDRAFDPVSNPLIRPLNRVWLREQFSGETQDLFKGYVEAVDQEWPGGGWSDATVTLSCVDEFKVLALYALPTTDPPRDTYNDVVLFDEPVGYWPMRYNEQPQYSAEAAVGKSLVPAEAVDFVGGSSGSTTYTGIIGDGSPEHGALITSQASSYTSQDLEPEDPLALASASAFSVEAWVAISFQSTSTVTILRGPQGLNFFKWRIRISPTGGLTVEIRDAGENLTSFSGGTINANTDFHHVVLSVGGGVASLYLDNVLVASAAWNGILMAGVNSTRFFTGYITIDPNSPADFRINADAGIATSDGYYYFDEVAIYRKQLSAARISAHYTAGTQRGWGTQRSGTRISAILDTINSHAPRNVDMTTAESGGQQRFIPATFMRGQAPLDPIREAVQAEAVDARFFSGREGSLTFLDAGHRNAGTAWSVYSMTLGDGAGELPYTDINFDYSESFLTNEWNVTREGGTLQTASDSTSISKYFKRSQSLTGLKLVFDSDAAAVANAMLVKYKDPQLRCTRVVLSTLDTSVAVNAFKRELGDKIRVLRTPPGGGARIDQQLFIQKIEISGQNDGGAWTVNWTVSPV